MRDPEHFLQFSSCHTFSLFSTSCFLCEDSCLAERICIHIPPYMSYSRRRGGGEGGGKNTSAGFPALLTSADQRVVRNARRELLSLDEDAKKEVEPKRKDE